MPNTIADQREPPAAASRTTRRTAGMSWYSTSRPSPYVMKLTRDGQHEVVTMRVHERPEPGQSLEFHSVGERAHGVNRRTVG